MKRRNIQSLAKYFSLSYFPSATRPLRKETPQGGCLEVNQMPEVLKVKARLSLRQARVEFTRLVGLLIGEAFRLGYEAALDEATERLTQKDPTSDHRTGSLHHVGLALDLLLYRNGTYLTETEDYRRLGEWWERQHPLARWGGRFGDGNHFSFEWEGRK